jgi:hypothetical protein
MRCEPMMKEPPDVSHKKKGNHKRGYPANKSKGTYNVGYSRGCVKSSGKIFFMYVRIRGRRSLVTFRQMSADPKFVWHAGLLGLDRHEKRRAKN